MTVPWTLAVNCLTGAVLMLSRLWPAQPDNSRTRVIFGALTITASVIAFAEVLRPLRFPDVLLGAWLAVAPLIR